MLFKKQRSSKGNFSFLRIKTGFGLQTRWAWNMRTKYFPAENIESKTKPFTWVVDSCFCTNGVFPQEIPITNVNICWKVPLTPLKEKNAPIGTSFSLCKKPILPCVRSTILPCVRNICWTSRHRGKLWFKVGQTFLGLKRFCRQSRRLEIVLGSKLYKPLQVQGFIRKQSLHKAKTFFKVL